MDMEMDTDMGADMNRDMNARHGHGCHTKKNCKSIYCRGTKCVEHFCVFEGITIELLCFVLLTKTFFPKPNVFLLQNCFGTNKMLHLDILKKPENVPLCFVNCDNEIKIWHANILFIQNQTFLFVFSFYIYLNCIVFSHSKFFPKENIFLTQTFPKSNLFVLFLSILKF
jgi:hypothetical protein